MQKLNINWQRLVTENETCPRCSKTGNEFRKAVAVLDRSFRNLGIKVEPETKKISLQEFKDNPLESNKIMINGKELEKWINGEVGQSECCDVCGPTDCRTIEIDGEVYEEIPAELIIKAGLFAAGEMIGIKKTSSCCESTSVKPTQSGCCG